MQSKLTARERFRLAGAALMGAAATLAFTAVLPHLVSRTDGALVAREGSALSADRPLESARLSLGASAAGAASIGEAPVPRGQVATRLEQVNGKLAALQNEKNALQRQQRELQGQLHTLADEVAERDRYKYDLTADDWKQLAAEARVRYRTPCLMPLEAAWKMPPVELDRLGLSPDDGEVVGEALRRSNRRVWATLRPMCLQIVENNDVVELLGAASCLQLIEKVASRRDLDAVVAARRQVAEVNAGLRPPPDGSKPQHPVFEALLQLSTEAQRFEADLAESFGPDEAKRVWHSMSCAMTRD